jgi:carbamoyltransferase
VLDGSGTRESQRAQLDLRESELDPIKYIDGDAKESISAYLFDGRELSLVYRFAGGASDVEIPDAAGHPYLHSLGDLWRWAAYYCCGSLNEAGKVMGLAPYGDPRRRDELRYLEFNEGSGAVRISFRDLARLTKPNIGGRDVSGDSHYEDIAANIQARTNDFLLKLVHFLDARHPAMDLCYSGGVALNGIANEQMTRATRHRVHMNGSCEDNGTAIGAALAVYHHISGRRVAEEPTEYYGRAYSEEEIEGALAMRGIVSHCRSRRELLDIAAGSLAGGAIVGWFQGRSEFGPRALGNRSILADPRNPAVREMLNVKIKMRERYRPYAPAVLEERASEFFDLEGASPSMLRVVPVKSGLLPGITHVDGSARLQTVSRRHNAMFYDLIHTFGEITGIPVLLNTSFNRAGEPIVESPQDAIDAFLVMKMDLLIMHDRAITRAEVSAELPSLAAGRQEDIQPEDRFFIRYQMYYRIWTANDGRERDIVHLYGLHRIIALELGALPLVEHLCRHRSFVAHEAVTWGLAGSRYAWEDLRRLLWCLLEGGFIERESDSGATRGSFRPPN